MNFLSTALHHTACITALFLLSACSPKYDWREVGAATAPYVIAFPSKPSSHTKKINLDGVELAMTMVAAEVDGISFAVATAELPDATQALVSLGAMKTAMLKNISGTIKQEKTLLIPQAAHTPGAIAVTEIEAKGPQHLLYARFLAKENHAYQLIVLGPEKSITRDVVTTFFDSFKLN